MTVAITETAPPWLATIEDLTAYREKPRGQEIDTSVFTMAVLAGSGALMRDGKAVRVTPAPRGTTVSQRSWVKIVIPHAEESSTSEELPKLMRLWFAAVGRCDSGGRADFDSRELEGILGCNAQNVRKVIAQGKRCGQFREESDARHVYLVGVANERPSAQRTAKRRRVEEAGGGWATARPRAA
ncbi:hypothetical protein ACT3TE_03125 [Brachybacterium sp. AOP42-B2-9]|uniref:hypothetical protein n=1 Tax=Brachybacterium sp. AOP42-B2-9 TaxID=3457672 RepID=UPI0040348215